MKLTLKLSSVGRGALLSLGARRMTAAAGQAQHGPEEGLQCLLPLRRTQGKHSMAPRRTPSKAAASPPVRELVPGCPGAWAAASAPTDAPHDGRPPGGQASTQCKRLGGLVQHRSGKQGALLVQC